MILKDSWGQVSTLRESLESEARARVELERSLEMAHVQLEAERTRRIAAEAVSAERRAECDRLLEQLREARAQYADLMGMHLKSVDAVNLKLMTPRAEEKLPDMSKFKDMAVEKLKGQIVTQIHQHDRAVDAALLATLHPKFHKFMKQKAEESTPTEPEGVAAV